MLDHHALEDVRDVLASISGVFEKVERLFPLDDHDRIALLVEETTDGLLMDAVRFVLEAIDLDGVIDETLVLFQGVEREADASMASITSSKERARP